MTTHELGTLLSSYAAGVPYCVICHFRICVVKDCISGHCYEYGVVCYGQTYICGSCACKTKCASCGDGVADDFVFISDFEEGGYFYCRLCGDNRTHI